MHDLSWPGSYGQENDPPCPPDPPVEPAPLPEAGPKRRRRSGALKLTHEEAKAVRIATRKLARAFGSYNRLAAMLEMPANTVRRIAKPKGEPATGT